MYRIATNECLTLLRQRRRRVFISLEDAERELASGLESDPLFTGDKIQLKLQQAVLKLPPQQRIIFNMKYFDGLKYEVIAENLGITVGGAKASYHHAVKKIEKSVLGN
jgi:RNA polymerase sigma-70 factor (ECF subfamily)